MKRFALIAASFALLLGFVWFGAGKVIYGQSVGGGGSPKGNFECPEDPACSYTAACEIKTGTTPPSCKATTYREPMTAAKICVTTAPGKGSKTACGPTTPPATFDCAQTYNCDVIQGAQGQHYCVQRDTPNPTKITATAINCS